MIVVTGGYVVDDGGYLADNLLVREEMPGCSIRAEESIVRLEKGRPRQAKKQETGVFLIFHLVGVFLELFLRRDALYFVFDDQRLTVWKPDSQVNVASLAVNL